MARLSQKGTLIAYWLTTPSKKHAASSVMRSPANRPTAWIPSGKPSRSKRPGTLTQGAPNSVHNLLKVGRPVELNPGGAAAADEGVRIMLTSDIRLAKA